MYLNSIYLKISHDSQSYELLETGSSSKEPILDGLSYLVLMNAIDSNSSITLTSQVFAITVMTTIGSHIVVRLSPEEDIGFGREFTVQQTLDLLSIANQAFAKCSSIEELCYQAVFLAKRKLCVDRASVLLVAPQENKLQGTWSTNEQGELCDDRDLRLDANDIVWLEAAIAKQSEVLILEDTDLYQRNIPVGKGWKAIVTIWKGDVPAGWFICDNLIKSASLGRNDRILISLFGLVLSQWFVTIETEGQLNQLNETLERQVQAKTIELQNTVDRLARIREDLVSNEKAKALSNFTAGIAHEINNPLGFIRSNLSFIGKVSSQVISAIDNHVAEELSGSREMLEEIDEVIDESVEGLDRVSAIISMLQPLNNLPSEVSQEFDALQSIEFYIMGLEMTQDCIKVIKPEHPVIVNLPLQAFTLALDNVVSNALDAVAEVEQPEISIRLIIDERHFSVQVQDNGYGISASNIGSIFDPFFTTKAVGKGMGLGLSVSDNLLKMVNGKIIAKSVEGKGTTMTIEFQRGVVIND